MKTKREVGVVRRIFWALILLAVIAMMCSCSNPAAGDEGYLAAFSAYFERLSAKELSDMYAMLTPESQQTVTEESFITRHKKIYAGIDAKDIRVEVIQTNPADATGKLGARDIRYRMMMDTLAGPIEFENGLCIHAERQDSQTVFLIDWDFEVIFPDLAADRPVRVETKAARHGEVRDRTGALLAGTGVIKAVGIVPGKLGEGRETSLLRIAEILGIPIEEIELKLAEAWVEDGLVVPIAELPESEEEKKRLLLEIPGIRIDDKRGRIYPYGKQVFDEGQYESVLRGVDGCRITITDAKGELIRVLAERAVVDGEDIVLDMVVGG